MSIRYFNRKFIDAKKLFSKKKKKRKKNLKTKRRIKNKKKISEYLQKLYKFYKSISKFV